MDTNKKLREHVSALADGELPEADVELAFAAMQEEDGRQAWDLYHLIRDTLRATPAPALSSGFAERLAGRLAREPALGLPASSAGGGSGSSSDAAETTGIAAILSNPGTP